MRNASGKRVGVIGLGRVGLPFALLLARRGFTVFGLDKNRTLIGAYRHGVLPFDIGISHRQFRRLLGTTFFPITRVQHAGRVDVWVIAVGAGGSAESDFGAAASVLRSIFPVLESGQCVIVRSTLPPGSTKKLARLIERKTSFRVGKTIFLAYCPERALEGRLIAEAPRLPQIVGADDAGSRRAGAALFRGLSSNILLSNSVSAELAKVFSNVYRYANFGLANELAMVARSFGEEAQEVIRLVNNGYIRGGMKYPGFAAGPCLPKSVGAAPRVRSLYGIGRAAYGVNEYLPRFVVKEVLTALTGKNRKKPTVAVLGLAFKGDIDDRRGSHGVKIVELLKKAGCRVLAHDPFLRPGGTLGAILKKSDAIVFGANHREYRRLRPPLLRRLAHRRIFVCDIWNISRQDRIFYWLEP